MGLGKGCRVEKSLRMMTVLFSQQGLPSDSCSLSRFRASDPQPLLAAQGELSWF